ncbi:hypothetical protein GE061_010312 [Apolygus lucorum]|uniref:Uncharacterized protein n=1 Tax=Apolygus lucorum TaxID=248454 RepID=A0A8S9Y5D2_APOLU|nr:hypothetical protein GE061_010312 [Apolygus lucorum]
MTAHMDRKQLNVPEHIQTRIGAQKSNLTSFCERRKYTKQLKIYLKNWKTRTILTKAEAISRLDFRRSTLRWTRTSQSFPGKKKKMMMFGGLSTEYKGNMVSGRPHFKRYRLNSPINPHHRSGSLNLGVNATSAFLLGFCP